MPSKLLCIMMFHFQGDTNDNLIIELDFMKFEIVAKLNVRTFDFEREMSRAGGGCWLGWRGNMLSIHSDTVSDICVFILVTTLTLWKLLMTWLSAFSLSWKFYFLVNKLELLALFWFYNIHEWNLSLSQYLTEMPLRLGCGATWSWW